MTAAYHPPSVSRRSASFGAVTIAGILAASLWVSDWLHAAAADAPGAAIAAPAGRMSDSPAGPAAASDLFEQFYKEKMAAPQHELPAQF